MSRLEIQDAPGSNHVLTLGPRSDRPSTDDVVLAVGHRTYSGGKSVLLSRAGARKLRDWLTTWLDKGWPGVPATEGPTDADVINHYQQIAVRGRINADHARCDAARRVDAALALIPPERRGDLAAIADQQSAVWHRMHARLDALEQTRALLVRALHDIQFAEGATAAHLRAAAGRALDRHAHPHEPKTLPADDAPIYQLDLLNQLSEAA